MMLLVSGATKTVRAHKNNPFLGQLHVPRQRGFNFITPAWAADNDAYSGFNEVRFVAMLNKIRNEPGCLFVPCPDVVGDAVETMKLFEEWEPMLKQRDLPVALVAQNGIYQERIPWRRFDALFIGGDDKFKEASQTAELVYTAKRFNKWVHMGRVNSFRRFRMAHEWGCDSVDGSSFSKWPDTWIPRFLGWLAALANQRTLFSRQLAV